MNRFLRNALLTALVLPIGLPLGLAAPCPAAAAEPSQSGIPALSTDKSVYLEGEDIWVTAYGEGKDWVGIYAKGEVPGGPPSIYWYYTASDAKSGEAVNIRTKRSNSRPEYQSLPGGAYTVFLLLDDGYTVSESVDILILPEEGKRLVPESASVYEGDFPVVTAFGAGEEWVGLWPSGADFREAEPLASFAVLPGNNGKKTALKPGSGSLSAGTYAAFLFPSSGTSDDPIAEAEFAVTAAKAPDAPVSGTYSAPRCAEGLAGGTVTVTLSDSPEGAAAEEVYLWWGKDGQPLDGMTRLARAHAVRTPLTLDLPEYLTIPEGAEEILVRAKNRFGESPVLSLPLPPDAVPYRQGEVLFRFQVTSDWHVTDDPNHDHNRHLGMMLDDIAEICPDSAGIVAVGDIADHGRKSEYAQAEKIIGKRENVPPIHYVIGNHDVSYGDGFERQMEIFNAFSGNDSLFFDRWIGGFHFLFIAADAVNFPLPIPQYEMDWIEEKLAEDASPEKPIFVFCHESILDTVAGSTAEEGWWGISNGKDLAALFSRYPQTIFFNGHSHWELASYNEMFAGDGKRDFRAFNTSSVGYLWTGYNVVPGEYLYGSEGLFVEVAEHTVTVRGRDFVTGEWTASAQYAVPGSWNVSASSEPEPQSETQSETQSEPEQGSEPAPEPSEPEAHAEGEQPRQEARAEKTGCASALHVSAALPLAGAAVLSLRRRKKSDPA